MADEFATPPEVAKFLRTTTQRLANDRYKGSGIPYLKHGRDVRYRWVDVLKFIEDNTVSSTHQRSGAA